MVRTVKDTVCWDVTAQSAGNLSAVLRNVLHRSTAFVLNIWKSDCTVSCLIKHLPSNLYTILNFCTSLFVIFVHLADAYVTHQ